MQTTAPLFDTRRAQTAAQRRTAIVASAFAAILVLAAGVVCLSRMPNESDEIGLSVYSRTGLIKNAPMLHTSRTNHRIGRFGMRNRQQSPRVTLEPPLVEDRVDTNQLPQSSRKNDIPLGYKFYETMLLVQPRLSEMEKDIQLGYFEKILGKGKAVQVMKLDRGKHPLAYPMNKHFEAYYVLYSYAGPSNLPRMIQDWSSNPGIDSEGQFLRVVNIKQNPAVPPPSASSAGGESANSDSLWDL
eukprot:CAMPEP_0114499406 /NCGR_PEP_ID=MMETSP0109-20121206/7401_1 /TAXON_ID=29199 /ORGANISM="Chlorarachnion reptans, Strain CCCM449" /LENGTH=242 /DNA_ID=CAMNT_0001676973 /DNA_START=85 /DNA_END=813 /DNA_ORIENTATION=+